MTHCKHWIFQIFLTVLLGLGLTACSAPPSNTPQDHALEEKAVSVFSDALKLGASESDAVLALRYAQWVEHPALRALMEQRLQSTPSLTEAQKLMEWLASAPTPSTLAVLHQVARSQDPDLRALAYSALFQIPTLSTSQRESALKHALKGTRDEAYHAIKALELQADESAQTALAAFYKTTSDIELQFLALVALGIADRNGLDAIRKEALSHADFRFRLYAAWQLAALGDTSSFESALEFILTTDNAETKNKYQTIALGLALRDEIPKALRAEVATLIIQSWIENADPKGRYELNDEKKDIYLPVLTTLCTDSNAEVVSILLAAVKHANEWVQRAGWMTAAKLEGLSAAALEKIFQVAADTDPQERQTAYWYYRSLQSIALKLKDPERLDSIYWWSDEHTRVLMAVYLLGPKRETLERLAQSADLGGQFASVAAMYWHARNHSPAAVEQLEAHAAIKAASYQIVAAQHILHEARALNLSEALQNKSWEVLEKYAFTPNAQDPTLPPADYLEAPERLRTLAQLSLVGLVDTKRLHLMKTFFPTGETAEKLRFIEALVGVPFSESATLLQMALADPETEVRLAAARAILAARSGSLYERRDPRFQTAFEFARPHLWAFNLDNATVPPESAFK